MLEALVIRSGAQERRLPYAAICSWGKPATSRRATGGESRTELVSRLPDRPSPFAADTDDTQVLPSIHHRANTYTSSLAHSLSHLRGRTPTARAGTHLLDDHRYHLTPAQPYHATRVRTPFGHVRGQGDAEGRDQTSRLQQLQVSSLLGCAGKGELNVGGRHQRRRPV